MVGAVAIEKDGGVFCPTCGEELEPLNKAAELYDRGEKVRGGAPEWACACTRENGRSRKGGCLASVKRPFLF